MGLCSGMFQYCNIQKLGVKWLSRLARCGRGLKLVCTSRQFSLYSLNIKDYQVFVELSVEYYHLAMAQKAQNITVTSVSMLVNWAW